MSAPAPRADGSSFDRVVDALAEYVANLNAQRRHADVRCPAHGESNASMSVDWRTNPTKGGVTLVKCHSGECDPRDILAAVGLSLSDTYDTEPYGSVSFPRVSSGSKGQGTDRGKGRGKGAAAAATSGGKGAAAPAGSRLGALEAEYPYVDAAGVTVGWFRRYAGKAFRWQKPAGDGGRRVFGQPKPCPLYRLPAVQAAAAGGVVHLAEGEKDADSLTAAGVVATTVPNGVTVTQAGGAKHLTGEHLEALRGAHVVVWADRDGPSSKAPERGFQGYRHALRMRHELAGIAASVCVVEAVEGKDASDHLQAGHGVDTAAEIDPVERVPAAVLARWVEADPDGTLGTPTDATVLEFPGRVDADDADDGDDEQLGGGGGGATGKKIVYVRDEYAVHHGNLVQVKRGKDEDKYLELLDAQARLMRVVVRDVGEGHETEQLVDLEVSKDGETHTVRSLPQADFEAAKWSSRVPLQLQFPRSPGGKGRLTNAIIDTSGAVPVETAYGLLGWREIAPGQWAYLHAGGAIGADGAMLGTRVEVSPRLQPFSQAPEVPSGDALRRSYDAVMAIADELPPHIAYPMIASGCRAVLGDCSTPVMAFGPTGSLKSGTAALIQQMYQPTARYDRLPAGAGEGAATVGGTEQLLHEAGHSVLVLDDLAPDRGTARSASRAAELIRSVANHQGKARLDRDTSKGLRADKPPRALMILTGEDQPSVQSAERRTVYVPFRYGEVTVDALKRASQPWMIEARSGVVAALAQRTAPQMPNTYWLEEQRDKWAEWLATDYDASNGLVAGRCNTVADLVIGLRELLDLVVDAGVVPREEAAQRWHEAWQAFKHLLAAQFDITDGRGLSERFSELVRSALLAGRAHLLDADGGKPPTAESFGWNDSSQTEMARAAGASIGWTDGATVWLEPGAAFAAGEAEGRAQLDPLDVSKRALKVALAQARPEAFERQRPGQSVPAERREHLSGRRRRVWALPVGWLYPDDADDGGGDGGQGAQSPPPLPFADCPPAGTPADPTPMLLQPDSAAADLARGDDPQPAATTAVRANESATRTPESPTPDAGDDGGVRERQPRYAAAGVVLGADGAYSINGTGPVEQPGQFATLDELLSWGVSLNLGVHHAGSTKARKEGGLRDDAGLIVVMPELASALGVPKKQPRPDKPGAAAKRIVKALAAAGWTVGKRGLSTYTQVWRTDDSSRAGRSHFLVFPGWSADPIHAKVESAAQLAYRLTLYASALGTQLVYNSGATGSGLLRTVRAETRRPLTEPVTEVPEPGRSRELAPLEDMEWDYWRDLSDDEAETATHIVGIDVNASYLAAAAQVQLGYGSARHVKAPALDDVRGRPGYFVLDPIPTSSPAGSLAPDLLDMHAGNKQARYARQDGAPIVVTGPMLAGLLEAGERPTIREAWTYDDTGKWMQSWAHRFRDAIYELKRDPAADDGDEDLTAALTALKLGYAAGLGQLASEQYKKGTALWLPNWNHSTKAYAQVSIWRKAITTAEQTGRHPVGISRDTIYYPATSPSAELPTRAAALQLVPLNCSGGFARHDDGRYVVGHVKWAGTARVADWHAARAVTELRQRTQVLKNIWTTPDNDGISE